MFKFVEIKIGFVSTFTKSTLYKMFVCISNGQNSEYYSVCRSIIDVCLMQPRGQLDVHVV